MVIKKIKDVYVAMEDFSVYQRILQNELRENSKYFNSKVFPAAGYRKKVSALFQIHDFRHKIALAGTGSLRTSEAVGLTIWKFRYDMMNLIKGKALISEKVRHIHYSQKQGIQVQCLRI